MSRDDVKVALKGYNEFLIRYSLAFSSVLTLRLADAERMHGPSMTRGDPILSETDSPGGPLVVGDHLFRDRCIRQVTRPKQELLAQGMWIGITSSYS